jgi:sirohydrochlorin ferrochelatase
METATLRHATDPAPALVLLFDRERLPLWDRAVNTLVEELEERLDDVFVTAATVAGTPSVADALVAARFSGCTWAVLALPADVVAAPGSFGRTALASVTLRCGADADAIATAYLAVGEPALETAVELAAGG